MTKGSSLTEGEMAALIRLSRADRSVLCSFGSELRLLDVPGNEWAFEALDEMRQRRATA